MVATRSLPARFMVARNVLAQDESLLQVTTGPRGEILALSIDRNPWSPDFARPPYQYTITCWRDGSIQSLRLTNVRLVLTHIVRIGSDAFMLVAERVRGGGASMP